VAELVKLRGWDRLPKVEEKDEVLDLLEKIRAGFEKSKSPFIVPLDGCSGQSLRHAGEGELFSKGAGENNLLGLLESGAIHLRF